MDSSIYSRDNVDWPCSFNAQLCFCVMFIFVIEQCSVPFDFRFSTEISEKISTRYFKLPPVSEHLSIYVNELIFINYHMQDVCNDVVFFPAYI